MKSADDIRQEFIISDILIELIEDQVKNDLYNNMCTSDLQGYCSVKAQEIIKIIQG